MIRGRTSTSRIAAAHTSRSQAAPSAPIRSMSPTETASPSCTHTIETRAKAAPERLGEKVTRPVKTTGTVHVHVTFTDESFRID